MPDSRSTHRRPLSRAVGARALAIALATAGIALFVGLVGPDAVLDALGRVPRRRAGLLVAAGLVPIALWGVSLWIVLRAVDVAVSLRAAGALFLSSVYLNGVTPFGQVGGDPPSGLLIGHVCDTTFESGLAAIASVNALNRIGVVFLGTAGAAWLSARAAAPEGLPAAVAVAAGITVVLVGVAVWAWTHRDAVVRFGGGAVAAAVIPIAERLPGVRTPTRASVIERGRGFVRALERLGTRPERIVAALALGVAGQLAVAGVLWLALDGVGAAVAPGVVLVVVPVAKLSGLAPLPGGSVGAEVLLSGLLVTASGVAPAMAAAVALLYRAAAFWVPTVLGGVATVGLLARASG